MEKKDSRIAVIGIIIEDREKSRTGEFAAAPIRGIYYRPHGDPLQRKTGKYYQCCPGCSRQILSAL